VDQAANAFAGGDPVAQREWCDVCPCV
jgi:hypothetical protein